jgi:hypothetical protein
LAQDTFFSYKRYRFFILNVLTLIVLIGIYIMDSPIGGRNGATVVGYTYGTLAALGIAYLMYYGIRKRSYHASLTTLKGTLSAHVWIGISLAFIVPMHCGFNFGLNIHTLAYVLMLMVILSGIYGAIAYFSLAPSIPSHRGAGTVKKHLEQIKIINSSIDDLLTNRTDRFVDLKRKVDFDYNPTLYNALFAEKIELTDRSKLAELLQYLDEKEQVEALKLIGLVDKKIELIDELRREVAVMTKMKIWLYVHLPISFALLAAVLIHIFVVFYYW